MKNEIHIWNLPIEKIYIKLKNPFREKFFEYLHKKFGSWIKAGKFLKVKRGDTLLAKNWKSGQCCCPLAIIFKISKILGISKDEIENNIKEIKYKTKLNKRGGSSGKPIMNPNLPININEDFVEILGHICGDGTITRNNPKKGIALKYINSEPTLIKSFQKKIKKIFGNISANIQVRSGKGYRRKNYVLQYPTIISCFVLSVFNYKAKEEMELPNFIFKMSKKSKCSFLRALFDDEGTVNIKEKRIVIGLKPQKPIEEIRNLLIHLKFHPTKIYKSGNILKISLQKNKDIILFNKIVGFKHPNKRKKLDIIINKGWKFDRYIKGIARNKIISFLKDKKEANTFEIIKFLERTPATVRGYLNDLKKDDLIFNRKTNKCYMWRINEQTQRC